MADRIQQRRDTAARWAQYNPVLLEGEVGYVTDDPNQYKIGDGVHAWNELPLRGFDGTLVHELGNSQTATMSQKGVTEAINNINSNTGVSDYPTFSESENYLAGNVVNYNGKLYRFTADHAAVAWIGTDVEETDVVKAHIVQEFGDNENAVISQGVITSIITEFNVSFLYPTDGIDGGNTYTLETAIQKINAEFSNNRLKGIRCSFYNLENELETWQYNGATFTDPINWEQVGLKRISSIEKNTGFTSYNCEFVFTKTISGTFNKTIGLFSIPKGTKIKINVSGECSWSRCYISALTLEETEVRLQDYIEKGEDYEIAVAQDLYSIRLYVVCTSEGSITVNITRDNLIHLMQGSITDFKKDLQGLEYEFNADVSSTSYTNLGKINNTYIKAGDILLITATGTAEWSRLRLDFDSEAIDFLEKDNTIEHTASSDSDKIIIGGTITGDGNINVSVKIKDKLSDFSESIDKAENSIRELTGYDEVKSYFKQSASAGQYIDVDYKAGDKITVVVSGTAEWSRCIVSAKYHDKTTRLKDYVVNGQEYLFTLAQNFDSIGIEMLSITTSGTLNFQSTKRYIGTIENMEEQISENKPFVSSINLLDEEDDNFSKGKLLGKSGLLNDSASYASSGYIPFTEDMGKLIASVDGEPIKGSGYVCLFDDSFSFIKSFLPASDGAIINWEEGVAYARFSFENYTRGNLQVNIGDIVLPYTKYGSKYDINKFPYIKNDNQVDGIIGHNGLTINQELLLANTMLTNEEFPYHIKFGVALSLIAEFDNFEDESNIIFGKGYSKYQGGSFKVTKDKLQYLFSTNNTEKVEFEHKLTINGFIRLVIYYGLNKSFVYLQTKGGEYKTEFDNTFSNNYELFLLSTIELKNIRIGANCDMFRSQLWAFGDSYFGMASNRVAGALAKLKFCNVLMSGIAGIGSKDMYDELKRILKFGCPKYIVWSLGMNDSSLDNYKKETIKILNLCSYKDITPIFALIPYVEDRDKTGYSEYIKSLGVRYIDTIQAVGANEDTGEWYEGYNSGDGLHPSALGSMAIAVQWLAEAPEIMEYGKIDFDVKLTDKNDDI